MIIGALPPSSKCTRFRSWEAASATCIPALTEPVIATIWGVGCWTSALPVSLSPHTTLKTPSGRNSAAISAIITVETGVVSEGLMTMVLPAAIVGAYFQIAIIIG